MFHALQYKDHFWIHVIHYVRHALLTPIQLVNPNWRSFMLQAAALGLIAPLAINFGLFELAGIICSRLQLDDAQCFDLM
jgi:hypothetical protein